MRIFQCLDLMWNYYTTLCSLGGSCRSGLQFVVQVPGQEWPSEFPGICISHVYMFIYIYLYIYTLYIYT